MSKEFKALQTAIEDLLGAKATEIKHTDALRKAFDSYCEKTAPIKRRKTKPKRVFIEISKGIPTIYATRGVEVFVLDDDIYEDGDTEDLCGRDHPYVRTSLGLGKPDEYCTHNEITVKKQEAMDHLRKEQEACA